MFHAVLIFKCSECGKEIATDTKIKDDDIPIVPVNLNFMDGTIGFACPFCNYFNNNI
jgi:DNA-directed RNA polymerase subunit RPC12/RpoP